MSLTIDGIINNDDSWTYDSSVNPKATRNAAKEVKNSAGNIAFFKSPKPHVLANEVLTYVLAHRLNLPCAITKFAKLNIAGEEQSGILSFRVSGFEAVEWDLAPQITNDIEEYIMNYEDLLKIGIFDAWTCNNDRAAANLILSRKNEWPDKFVVYMIDNEECFYGFQDECNRLQDANLDDIGQFIKLPHITKYLRYSKADKFISKIENLSDNDIQELISLIPIEYYNADKSQIVLNILKSRRDKLRRIIEDWCKKK